MGVETSKTNSGGPAVARRKLEATGRVISSLGFDGPQPCTLFDRASGQITAWVWSRHFMSVGPSACPAILRMQA